jgi:HAD superfamily hydrolase (TIGR01490 family)
MQNLAVFDFDGTLSKGYISIDFLHALHEAGLYTPKYYNEQMKLLESHRRGELSYDDWCARWAELWTNGLKGSRQEKVSAIAASFFEKFKENIYQESYDIIRNLKQSGYEIVLLSVGASEVINLAASELGVHKSFSTALEIRDGVYTGRIETDFHKPRGKENCLRKLLTESVYDKTVGFGDSETDIGFIELLQTKVALNPSEKLKDFATKHGWQVLRFK